MALDEGGFAARPDPSGSRVISPAVAALADSALLLPASALLLAYLVVAGRGALAAAFAAGLVAAGSTTLAAKLLFHACGGSIGDGDVVSPSGHVSFAAIFYGSLAVMLVAGRPAAVRAAAAILILVLVLAVSVSRVRTGAHTSAEVLIGLGIGFASVAGFAWLHTRSGQEAVPWRPVAIGFAAALLLLGGLHFSLEHRIGALARRIADVVDVCAIPERPAAPRLLSRSR